jgi:DNA-binding MurR/RpiR family transcriptional regulator
MGRRQFPPGGQGTARARSGATLVVITSFRGTLLALLAEVLLVAGSQEHAVRVEALASRLVHLTILDTVFMRIVQADPEAAKHALAEVQDMLERGDL